MKPHADCSVIGLKLRVADFDFELPEHLIALRPAEPRGSARLLHVRPGAALPFYDRQVADLPSLLRPGDAFVINDTKVLPAQIEALRPAREGAGPDQKISLTFHKRLADGTWLAFAKPARRLRPGDALRVAGTDAGLNVLEKHENGEIRIGAASPQMTLDALLQQWGRMPLPPYIASRRAADNRDHRDYQTVFAAREGAVAAPTAGLHLTDDLLQALTNKGVHLVKVTLHVGAGTFLPVKTDDTESHVMHAEWGEISPETADELNTRRAGGGRIVSCGTTALRLLETAADEAGLIRPFAGETDIFITPGYRFRAVDLLMTNFHLPRSTLFMLVSAFCGLDMMKRAYAHAIEAGYRFYSYGDSSLLERADLR